MAVNLKRKPRRARPRRRTEVFTALPESRGRRLFDLGSALILLTLTAPLLILGVFMVALTGRPILFEQPRMGRGGMTFKFLKLRTMRPDAEQMLDEDRDLRDLYERHGFKVPGRSDPRITWTGRWLRRLYLDELPQLFNVLRGDMSLIGPRPMTEGELLRYYGERMHEVLRVKPGLFGAWTSLGRQRPPYPERARLELEYVRRRSLPSELRILARSLPAVLSGQTDFM
jgi:lipopolysaccharide/colanic/teichoic acid biosynthesis glycosyltransferase